MRTPTQKQRARYWQAICMLFPGGEGALIKCLIGIADDFKSRKGQTK